MLASLLIVIPAALVMMRVLLVININLLLSLLNDGMVDHTAVIGVTVLLLLMLLMMVMG